MAMTYSNLIDSKSNTESVAYWVNSTILPVTSILTDAQAFIYSQLRVREMRGYADLTVSVGTSWVELPTGFLGPIVLLDNYGVKIRLFEESMLWRARSFDSDGVIQRGPISRYAIFDEKAQFDTGSDVATSFPYLYYKLPTALGTGNETNFLTTRYPHLLRQACVAMAYSFLKDFEAEKSALAKVVSFIQSANEESDLSRFGGDYPVEDMRDG